MDSATTSRFSGMARLIPISVSVPNCMSIAVSFYYQHSAESILCCGRDEQIRLALNRIIALRLTIALPIRRQAHHVAGFEVGQLQPVFRDVARREQIILAILAL